MTLEEFLFAFGGGVIAGAYPVSLYYQGWRKFFMGMRPMKLRTTIIFSIIVTVMIVGGDIMQMSDPKFYHLHWTEYAAMGGAGLLVFQTWMSALATWMDQYDTQRKTAVRPGHDQPARDRDRTLGPPHCRQE